MKSILIDLMKRETANFSADFSNVLVRKLKRSVTPSRATRSASAAFKVLKQTHSPSVLVELGYLSHREDEKLLNLQRLAEAGCDRHRLGSRGRLLHATGPRRFPTRVETSACRRRHAELERRRADDVPATNSALFCGQHRHLLHCK